MTSNTTTTHTPAGTEVDESEEFPVCDLSAIPIDEREAHFELGRTLLFGGEQVVSEVESGLLFELPADRLGDAVRFVENERRCCKHLTFTLQVPPRGANLTLGVTGPGAREELRALAR